MPKVKNAPKEYRTMLSEFPNFHKTGNITGMRKLYYGRNALLVRCGEFIYNVSSKPEIYNNL